MHTAMLKLEFYVLKISIIFALLPMRTDAELSVTADEYYAVNEGLTSIHGDPVWGVFDYAGTNTVNLSYNAFTNTSLSELDFRETMNAEDHEQYIHHLDLSYNQITEASLEFFTLSSTPWILVSLDLSFNSISDLTSFPRKIRGDLEILNLEHNMISVLGSLHPAAIHSITVDISGKPAITVNLEHNNIKRMPWLLFDYVTDAVINVKNNHISVVDPPGSPSVNQGYWFLKVINFENNNLTQFTYAVCFHSIQSKKWRENFPPFKFH